MRKILLLFIACILSTIDASATTYFEDGFEEGVTKIGTTTPNPVWAWKAVDVLGTGLMYGDNDMWGRSTTLAHSGSYSLRLDLDGRNGFCNADITPACVTLTNSGDNQSYFVDAAGSNLDTLFNVGTHKIWNKTKYFERYSIDSFTNSAATNDQANVTQDGNPIHSFVGGDFDTGDEIKICNPGTEGTNRSDCDLAIGYFTGMQTSHLPASGSLFRRFYFYIPSSTVLPNVTQKIGYFHTTSNKVLWIYISTVSMEIRADGDIIAYADSNVVVDKDVWLYVEEQYKAESSLGAGDGEYRVWFGADGNVPVEPIIEQTGLALPAGLNTGTGMGFWGNWQNTNTAIGYIYVDDFVVGTERIGEISTASSVFKRPSLGNKTFVLSGSGKGVALVQ